MIRSALIPLALTSFLLGQAASAQEAPLAAHVLGVDAAGVELVCGNGLTVEKGAAGGIDGFVGWEMSPGVIRADGEEAFRVEVSVTAGVTAVTLDQLTPLLSPPQPPGHLDFRDDGSGVDRVAGDGIFTAGPFRSNPAVPPPRHFQNDPESPEGLYSATFGNVSLERGDGSSSLFAISPSVGLLSPEIPEAPAFQLAEDLQVTPHLINLGTEGRVAQRFLRGTSGTGDLTRRLYQVVPDAFDILTVFSTHHLEWPDRQSALNRVAGRYSRVRVSYTGTGLATFDDAGRSGSRERLLGVSVLDSYDRGITAKTATHEILHQWGANLCSCGGLLEIPHYSPRSNVGSLLGGFAWESNGDGTFRRDCTTGTNEARRAAPLDLYLMGLIDGSEVPDLRLELGDGNLCFGAGEPITDFETTTLAEIQRLAGVRQPGPEGAQRHFRLGFVAESHGRLLNGTELTFYDRLAAHYVRDLPPEAPDPRVAFNNWSTISRFFGHGTEWSVEIPGVGDPGGPSRCEADEHTLCLLDGRFRVQVDFETANQPTGRGGAVGITGDSGAFWFFRPGNLEVFVKMLDDCGNPRAPSFWAFHTGLTNVGVVVTITDTETWEVRRYSNPRGTPLAPVFDTRAFETCPATEAP